MTLSRNLPITGRPSGVEQGAHPKEIQARLRHSSITTTLDRYGHLIPGLGRQLSQNVDEMRAKTRRDMEQTWNNEDAEIIEFPYELEEFDDLPGDLEVGGTGINQ